MEDILQVKNITFCSLELYWTDKNKKENSNDCYEYELLQYNGGFFSSYKSIYIGKNTNFIVKNLEPNHTYIFKLKIKKNEDIIDRGKKTLKTKRIKYILPKITNEEKLSSKSNEFLKIVENCSALIFNKKDENIIKGNFNGIEIQIANESEKNIYYVSFDINPANFKIFFSKFIEESKNDIILPCHFLLNKLPTILILNLLKNGTVILTGKRMGGVIASTLAFCILYTGKLYNKDINFGNSFLKNEKNCIGVITFGSPSFLFNKEVGIEMIGFSSYFCNIKDSSDYIPIILDSINTLEDFNELFDILKEHEFKENGYEINLEDELKKEYDIYNSVRIPFGFYYMMENTLNLSLKLMTGDDFEELYKFMSNSNVLRSNINIYSKISSKAEFNKKHL